MLTLSECLFFRGELYSSAESHYACCRCSLPDCQVDKIQACRSHWETLETENWHLKDTETTLLYNQQWEGNGQFQAAFFYLFFIKVKFELVNWRWYLDHWYTWRHSFMCLHTQFIAQTTVNTYLHQTSDWSSEVSLYPTVSFWFSLPLQSFIIWTSRTSDSSIPESLLPFLLSE